MRTQEQLLLTMTEQGVVDPQFAEVVAELEADQKFSQTIDQIEAAVLTPEQDNPPTPVGRKRGYVDDLWGHPH